MTARVAGVCEVLHCSVVKNYRLAVMQRIVTLPVPEVAKTTETIPVNLADGEVSI
jgi:hypothetical protein